MSAPDPAAHRAIPVSRTWDDEPLAHTEWRCLGCGATWSYLDEVTDSVCPAIQLFATVEL